MDILGHASMSALASSVLCHLTWWDKASANSISRGRIFSCSHVRCNKSASFPSVLFRVSGREKLMTF